MSPSPLPPSQPQQNNEGAAARPRSSGRRRPQNSNAGGGGGGGLRNASARTGNSANPTRGTTTTPTIAADGDLQSRKAKRGGRGGRNRGGRRAESSATSLQHADSQEVAVSPVVDGILLSERPLPAEASEKTAENPQNALNLLLQMGIPVRIDGTLATPTESSAPEPLLHQDAKPPPGVVPDIWNRPSAQHVPAPASASQLPPGFDALPPRVPIPPMGNLPPNVFPAHPPSFLHSLMHVPDPLQAQQNWPSPHLARYPHQHANGFGLPMPPVGLSQQHNNPFASFPPPPLPGGLGNPFGFGMPPPQPVPRTHSPPFLENQMAAMSLRSQEQALHDTRPQMFPQHLQQQLSNQQLAASPRHQKPPTSAHLPHPENLWSEPASAPFPVSNSTQEAPLSTNTASTATVPAAHVPVQMRSIPPQAFLDGPFSSQIRQACRSLEPLPEEYGKHQETVNLIEAIVKRVFGKDALLHQFGSTASGTLLRGSADMDVCVELTLDQVQRLEEGRLEKLKLLEEEIQREEQEWELEREKLEQERTEQESNGDIVAEDQKDEDAKPPKRFKRKAILTVPQHILELLGEALEKEERASEIKVLVHTRVPIVKYRDTKTGINVDVGYNNLLAVYNTQLLYTYSLIDERFNQLVRLVKFWAKRRFINDTYSGTLSSYAYVVMVIHFLQYACHPPVLPSLQSIGFRDGAIRKTLTVDGETFDVDFFRDVDRLGSHWPFTGANRNQDSVGKLFYLFLYYWAHEFTFREHVASIRTGALLTKEYKDWTPMIEKSKKKTHEQDAKPDGGKEPIDADDKELVEPVVDETEHDNPKEEAEAVDAPSDKRKPRLQRFWICIEDPFEISHNLGRPVGRDSLYFIRGEFLQAVKQLHNPRNYPRNYVQDLIYGGRLRHPDILSLILAESPYKTRDEHKQRNQENMDMSDRRRAAVQKRNTETLSVLVDKVLNEQK